MSEVIAVLCSDIHLSERVPSARSAEPDWLEAQARPLEELKSLAEKHDCPVVAAGDIFDRYNSSAALINWAIRHLPKMYAIPGQHDLPHHNYEDIEKSAYHRLTKAGKIINIDPTRGQHITIAREHSMQLYGYPWGYPIKKLEYGPSNLSLNIALIHEYCWVPNKLYPGAPEEQQITNHRKQLTQFDVVVFGDNHKGFKTTIQCPFRNKKGYASKTSVFNCGTLMKRTIDEVCYVPRVGIIMDDGTIKIHYLNTEHDIIDTEHIRHATTPELDVTEFMDALEGLQRNPLDFRLAVEHWIQKTKPSKEIEQELLASMEKKK